MPLFKQRKPRQFQYKSRFNNDGENHKESFQSQWEAARNSSKRRGGKLTVLPILIVLLIMVLILLYILKGYE
ncbi:hypothetical protein [Winogradskyella sp. 3972H.M.0a.05]|uniref:hypothetical protein n=1 Tax=Winogradskyella sp. 3972H.M.0a.05 TaxID=2950277 RepID=UPI0033958B83